MRREVLENTERMLTERRAQLGAQQRGTQDYAKAKKELQFLLEARSAIKRWFERNGGLTDANQKLRVPMKKHCKAKKQ